MEKIIIRINLLIKYISLTILWKSHIDTFKKSISDRRELTKSSDSEIFFDIEIYGDKIVGYIDRLILKNKNQRLPNFNFIYNNIKNESILSSEIILQWINNRNNIEKYPIYSQYILILEETILQTKDFLQDILKLEKKEQTELWGILKTMELFDSGG